MRGLSAICAVCLAVSVGSVARAQAPGPNDDARKQAIEHYKNAETAMAGQAYEYAASEYGMAYEIMKDPVLFFKIGTADEKAGKCSMAVIYYKRYIKEGIPAERAKADDPKKSEADKQKILAAAAEHEKSANERIAACSGNAGSAPAGSGSGSGSASGSGSGSGSGSAKSAAVTTTTTGAGAGAGTGSETAAGAGSGTGTGTGTGAGSATGSDDTTAALGSSLSEEKPSGKRTVAWISVATSIAAGTVGAVLLLSANSTEKDIEDLYTTTGGMRPPAYDNAAKTRYDQLVSDGNRFNTLAEVSFGVCGAAAITAIVLFATDHGGEHRDEHALRVVPTVTPNAAGFTAAFRF